jgi:hypothetical protein
VLAAEQCGQIAPLLLLGRVQGDLVHAQVRVRAIRQAHRGRGARNLLHRDDVGEIAHARAAVALRHRQPEQTELSELTPEVAREEVAAVDLAGARGDPFPGEAAHLIAHGVDGLSQPEIELAVGGSWHRRDPIVNRHRIVG